MPRLYRGIWRAASSASTSSLCRLLQSYPNALVIGQGLAGVARHRAMRSHIGCANSGRIAPPIRQDLVCDRDRWFASEELQVKNIGQKICAPLADAKSSAPSISRAV